MRTFVVKKFCHAVFVYQDSSRKHDAFFEIGLYPAAVCCVDDALSVSLAVEESAFVNFSSLAIFPTVLDLAFVSSADKVLTRSVVHLHAAMRPAIYRVAYPVLGLVVIVSLASAVRSAVLDFTIVADFSTIRRSDMPDLLHQQRLVIRHHQVDWMDVDCIEDRLRQTEHLVWCMHFGLR